MPWYPAFTSLLGIELKSSCLYDKYFTDQDIHPTQDLFSGIHHPNFDKLLWTIPVSPLCVLRTIQQLSGLLGESIFLFGCLVVVVCFWGGLFFCFFEIGSHYIPLAGLELPM